MQGMQGCQSLPFPKALVSFLGHLEGTLKSANTIANYRVDLRSFESFLQKTYGTTDLEARDLTALQRYSEALQVEGDRVNTRRRKLLTAAKFLRYLSARNKVGEELQRRIPTPGKLERIPSVAPYEELLALQRALPQESSRELRIKLLIGLLLETAGLVTEVVALRFEDLVEDRVRIGERGLELSLELRELAALARARFGTERIFPGSGASVIDVPMSARSAEMLVKEWARGTPWPALTPRMLRDSTAIHWGRQGVAPDLLLRRLGLQTNYVLRRYLPLLRSQDTAESP